jgi:hypothetical protein
MDPATQIRECLVSARASRKLGMSDCRRHFVEYALYWRRVRRLGQ